MTINILVAAERALVREAFVTLLSDGTETVVVGEASSGVEALELAQALRPDVVLLDLSAQGMDGIATTRMLKSALPDIQVILIGASLEEEPIVEAVRAGARGYITRHTDGAMLIDQIRRAASGGVALSEAMTTKLINALAEEKATAVAPSGSPSAREREVLALLCEGATNKGIASSLVVSENTVRAHIRSLMQKLDADNRTQLAIYAMNSGMGPEAGGSSHAKATSPATITPPSVLRHLRSRSPLALSVAPVSRPQAA